MSCFNPGWIKRFFQDLSIAKRWRLKSHERAQSGATNQCALSEDDQPLLHADKLVAEKAFTSTVPGLELSLSYSSSFESTPQADTYSTKRCEIVNPGPIPDLDCLIITSYGDSPPPGVAEKQKSTFLKGVGKDSDIMQNLIYQDDHKVSAKVMLVCHFKQETVEACKEEIKQKMDNIKLKSQKGRKYSMPIIRVYRQCLICLSVSTKMISYQISRFRHQSIV